MDKTEKPYPVTAWSAILFLPMLLLVLVGIIAGHIASPVMSGFIAARKQSRDFWHFNDLEQ